MAFRTPNMELDKSLSKVITFKLKYLHILKICLIITTRELYQYHDLQKKGTFSMHFHYVKSGENTKKYV